MLDPLMSLALEQSWGLRRNALVQKSICCIDTREFIDANARFYLYERLLLASINSYYRYAIARLTNACLYSITHSP